MLRLLHIDKAETWGGGSEGVLSKTGGRAFFMFAQDCSISTVGKVKSIKAC